jgi:hypothetical protein
MRRQARADKIRITTLELERRRDGRAAVAARKVEKASFEEVTLRIRTILAIAEARDRARLRGHAVGPPIRVHSGRAAARCSACDARVYVDASAEPAFAEGEVFEEECSGL